MRSRLALMAAVGAHVFAAALLAGCSEPSSSASRSLRSVLGSDDTQNAGFAVADRPHDFAFPRDHGPHPAYRSEWWYLTAVVATATGREYGIQFTLFRQGIEPRPGVEDDVDGTKAWRTGQVYMGHVAVSDVARRRHLEAERFSRGHTALAGVDAMPFRAYIDGWTLASTATEFWPLRLEAATPEFGVDLTLSGTRPFVRQGDNGLSRKGANNASYYYSAPRIEAAGNVSIGSETHAVSGNAWLDREWSTSVLAPEYAGWDWFALHLDDGRDLMLYQLRRIDGQIDAYNAGTFSFADALPSKLTAGDFTMTATEHWRGWPVAWALGLGDDERFTIRAAFEDQVMDTSVRYWEGVAYVEDDNGRRVGRGYMELTGY